MFKLLKNIIAFLFLLIITTAGHTSEKEWIEAYSKIEQQVENVISGKVYVSFSAYNSDEDDIPIDNLNETVVFGKIKFSSSKGIWRKNVYVSSVIENPTWLDITVLANQMIVETGDTHHVFLEDIEFLRIENGIKIYDFVMGS